MKLPAAEPVPDGHPSQETRDLRPDDQFLRRHGWAIHARPRRGPALWVQVGLVCTQAEALALCRVIEAEGAGALKGIVDGAARSTENARR